MTTEKKLHTTVAIVAPSGYAMDSHAVGRATVRLEPEGNHSCNNLATVVRPVVADWVTDRLGSAHD